ncbi:MAG: hypothetical protein ACRDND_29025, partial [Streptosporangiaceae bacterium]
MRPNLPGPAGNVPLAVIGVVRSAPTGPETTPIRAALNRAGRGTIEIAEPSRESLAGLDGFGYAWLLTRLHRPGGRPRPTHSLTRTARPRRPVILSGLPLCQLARCCLIVTTE